MTRPLILVVLACLSFPAVALNYWSLDLKEHVAYEMIYQDVKVSFWTEQRVVDVSFVKLIDDHNGATTLSNYQEAFVKRLQENATAVYIKEMAHRWMLKNTEMGGYFGFGRYDSRYADKIYPIVTHVKMRPVSLIDGVLALETLFDVHLSYQGISAHDYMKYSEIIYLELETGVIHARADVFAQEKYHELLSTIQRFANAEIEQFSEVLNYQNRELKQVIHPQLVAFDTDAYFYCIPWGDQLKLFIHPFQKCTDSIYLSGLEMCLPLDSFRRYFNSQGPYASLGKPLASTLKNTNDPLHSLDVFSRLESGDPALEAFQHRIKTARIDSCSLWSIKTNGDSVLRRVIHFKDGLFERVKWMAGKRLDLMQHYYFEHGVLKRVITYYGHGPIKSQETFRYDNHQNMVRKVINWNHRLEMYHYTYLGNSYAIFSSPLFCKVREENRTQNIFTIDPETFTQVRSNAFLTNHGYVDEQTGTIRLGRSIYFNYNEKGYLTERNDDYTVRYIYENDQLTKISRYRIGYDETLTTIDYNIWGLPKELQVYNSNSQHFRINYHRR